VFLDQLCTREALDRTMPAHPPSGATLGEPVSGGGASVSVSVSDCEESETDMPTATTLLALCTVGDLDGLRDALNRPVRASGLNRMRTSRTLAWKQLHPEIDGPHGDESVRLISCCAANGHLGTVLCCTGLAYHPLAYVNTCNILPRAVHFLRVRMRAYVRDACSWYRFV
jgi:hypothetical protein